MEIEPPVLATLTASVLLKSGAAPSGGCSGPFVVKTLRLRSVKEALFYLNKQEVVEVFRVRDDKGIPGNYSKLGLVSPPPVTMENFQLAEVIVSRSGSSPSQKVDWQKCILCQEETEERMCIPANARHGDANESYLKLATTLEKFEEIGELNSLGFKNLNLPALDEGNGIAHCMSANNAVWHKSCHRECNKNRLERAMKRARNRTDTDPKKDSPRKTRRVSSPFSRKKCLFCNNPPDEKNELHTVVTQSTDAKIRQYATELQDRTVLMRIEGAQDLVALEAAYHSTCYAQFLNRRRAWKLEHERALIEEQKQQECGYALAEITAYIESVRDSCDGVAPVFKLSDLKKRYSDLLEKSGIHTDVHSTRFKERLLALCPKLQATGDERQNCLITFRKDIHSSVRTSCKRDYDREAQQLAVCADLVRKDIFNHKPRSWEDMSAESGEESVPHSLKSLIRMLLRGSNSFEQDVSERAVLTIAQLISFNAKQKERVQKQHETNSASRRHDRSRETPVPVYLALKIYGETRKKDLVETTHQLGLSVSYDRVKTIVSEKANAVCETFLSEGVVCPVSLKPGIFTTGAVDNIDHNPSATTASGSFHGTAISLTQHPSQEDQGGSRRLVDSRRGRTVEQLPPDYINVPLCLLNGKAAKCPSSSLCTIQPSEDTAPYLQEKGWLESLQDSLLPWSVYHSSQNSSPAVALLTSSALLPVLPEVAHTMAMMQHSMQVVAKATKFLNPGQIPVLTADQPLFALCKQVQYLLPATLGEDKFFVMFGGLHIEMTALRFVGQWLDKSGWVEALVKAEVTTEGRAESMVKASHVTRTRYVHEVTAASLHLLQEEAYKRFLEDSDDISMPFHEWRAERLSTPQFKYWDTVLRLELLVLQLVRSMRARNFPLYVETLVRLMPWFFSLDHVNYARWLSVHIRDLVNLEERFPDLARRFNAGNFVAVKTPRPFSAIALDQQHEQLNAQLKGDGGMVGLTETPDALRKWMLGAPEIAGMVQKFEEGFARVEHRHTLQHHNDTASHKERFSKDVLSLQTTFCELGNPFLEEGKELYNLDSKKVACQDVVSTVMTIEALGKSQYLEFVRTRLEECTAELAEPIKRNRLALFSTPAKTPSQDKARAKFAGMKNDMSLFGGLYVACQKRAGDLDDFFSHENQPSPPALADELGYMRSTTKSDLAKSLLEIIKSPALVDHPRVQAKIIDGAALVHLLHPSPGQKTFRDYVVDRFLNFIRKECQSGVGRIDVVWDRYLPDSLKSQTREKRGAGSRMKVGLCTRLPSGWLNFLRDPQNKEELFNLLAVTLVEQDWGSVQLYSTIAEDVVTSSGRSDLSLISPCNHEEADTRLLLHCADAVSEGHQSVLIRTVDTDVLVIAVSCVGQLPELKQLWVHFGTGTNQQFIPAHEIASALGPSKSLALPVFHAFTGCDNVSAFFSKGKVTAFNAWKAHEKVTQAFLDLSKGPYEQCKDAIEDFVVCLYSKTAPASVNECRKTLFLKSRRELKYLPPTSDALEQHALRATYQGSFVWGQSLQAQMKLPDPSLWGWCKDPESGWTPVWGRLPPAPEACLELVKCGCRKGCNPSRCTCIKNKLPCTQLCFCDGCTLEE